MALLEKQLEVKESTIPGAGKGLFTKIFIPKGTRIVEYKGKLTTWKEVENDYKNGYIYSINTKAFVGCEGEDRTPDLRVMSPTSYRCSTSRYNV